MRTLHLRGLHFFIESYCNYLCINGVSMIKKIQNLTFLHSQINLQLSKDFKNFQFKLPHFVNIATSLPACLVKCQIQVQEC